MRVVIDTNVLISGLFFGGNPRKILILWQEKRYVLLSSQEIMEEYEDVLYRLVKKAKKKNEKFVSKVLSMLKKDSLLVKPDFKTQYSRDKDDDKFIDCALSGKADYIVSGDIDLLEIGQVQSVKIINAKQFLEKNFSDQAF